MLKISYVRSLLIHFSFFTFIIIPSAFLFPSPPSSESVQNIQLITMSEKEFIKLFQKNKRQDREVIATPNVTQKAAPSLVDAISISKPEAVPRPAANPMVDSEIKRIVLKKNKDDIANLIDAVDKKDKEEGASITKSQKIEEKITPAKLEMAEKEEEPKVSASIAAIPQTEQKKEIISGVFGSGESTKVSEQDVDISILTVRDLVAVQLTRCWSKHVDDRDGAREVVVTATVKLKRDGSIGGILINPKIYMDQKLRIIYEDMVVSAHEAVHACSPLKGLPLELYSDWSSLTFNFRNDMSLQ